MSKVSKQALKVRVATYNVLSSALAGPTHFTSCDPSNLEFEQRLPRVISKIEDETKLRAIICLQEVSHEFAGPLHAFFAKNNYQFVSGLYGSRFSNYMGVGLALPMDVVDVVDIDLATLSDVRAGGWPKQPPEDETIGLVVRRAFSAMTKPVRRVAGRIISAVGAFISNDDEPYMVKLLKGSDSENTDHWKMSQRRKNMLVFARLKDKRTGKNFCVSTYHMPCAFFAPMVMNIHVEMAAKRTQDLAEGEACVLAGDFNLKPGSPEYNLITTGALGRDDPTYPASKYGVDWNIEASPMKSAYALSAEGEPDFTNYSKVSVLSVSLCRHRLVAFPSAPNNDVHSYLLRNVETDFFAKGSR